MSDTGQLELTVPSSAENIPLIRHAVAGFLDGHAVPEPLAADVLLAVTEACTNVVQHAYIDGDRDVTDIELAAEREGPMLTISVRDYGRGFAPRVDSPGLGLGLPVIAAVTQNVEIRPAPDTGTVVVMSFSLD